VSAGIVLIILVVLVVVLALVGAGMYNGLIKLRNVVQESWRQIDVELNRRHDLIPNLVETVRGYAAHERETLQAVTEARTRAAAPGSSPLEQAQQENVLTAALGRLFAVAEAYPDLKANQGFLQLQRDLTDTEDRVAAARRFYNANVRALNTKVQTVPSNLVANLFKIAEAEYFEAQDPQVRQVPTVSFGAPAPQAPATPPSSAPPSSGPPVQDTSTP
jgi:LemA protein